MDVNKVTLLGRIGAEPVLAYTQAGKAYMKFSVATGVNWKDDAGEWQNKTSWHNIQVWGKSAEFLADKIGKGSKIYLEGSIGYSDYEKDGKKMYFTNIVAQTVIPIESSGETVDHDESPLPKEGDNSVYASPTEEPF